jgi:release factor glutamine methyltransferase
LATLTPLAEAISKIASRLRAAGIVSFEAESEILLADFLGISRGELSALALTGEERDLSELEELVRRRELREPLQHITGKAPFRSIELQVGPGVFVPRFETELVTQVAIDFLRTLPKPGRAVDVGTGSGAIAISLALETSASVAAIEQSAEACEFARRNIAALAPEVELIHGDFADTLPSLQDVDLVISNPPYIPSGAVPLDPEVRDFDPEAALYSGEDGLNAIRELAVLAQIPLRSGGLLVIEHADTQSDEVSELLLSEGWRAVSVHPDNTGRLRAVSASRK